MSGHTPGPWAYKPSPHDDWGIVRAGEYLICHVSAPENRGRDYQAHCRKYGIDPYEANARLIAAAPDMLKALKAFRSYGCPVCSGDCASANPPVATCPMQMASNAIAKAEGR